MRKTALAPLAALSAAAVLLTGCYTVIQSPYASAAAPVEERYDREEGPDGDYLSPRVGRFRDRDGYDDYWGFGGSPYGYGIPIYGSWYGTGYGAPYGYSGYHGSYGPYGYGYDPYYYGSGGAYVPPGYELVTESELEQLREDSRLLHSGGSSGPSEAELEELRQEEARRAEQTWQRRVDARQRKAPQPTVRTVTTSSGSTSSSSASKPASTETSGAKSAKERKTRR